MTTAALKTFSQTALAEPADLKLLEPISEICAIGRKYSYPPQLWLTQILSGNTEPHPPPSISHLSFLLHPVVIYCIYLEAVFYEYCSLSINLIKPYLQGYHTFTLLMKIRRTGVPSPPHSSSPLYHPCSPAHFLTPPSCLPPSLCPLAPPSHSLPPPSFHILCGCYFNILIIPILSRNSSISHINTLAKIRVISNFCKQPTTIVKAYGPFFTIPEQLVVLFYFIYLLLLLFFLFCFFAFLQKINVQHSCTSITVLILDIGLYKTRDVNLT